MGAARGEIQRQIRLPWRKALEIALRSLRVRLARSVLTLITIMMALAFLTTMWAQAVCEPVVRQAALAAQGVIERGGGTGGAGGGRLAWLLSLSLLVCLVGISNAMLMSVMERFREIGTMKCLGALDSFILKLFLIESLLLGATGTIVGVALGLGLNFLLMVKHFGGVGATALPWHRLLPVAAGSVAIGVGITLAAALYPAWKAAQMEPIAALRVEV